MGICRIYAGIELFIPLFAVFADWHMSGRLLKKQYN